QAVDASSGVVDEHADPSELVLERLEAGLHALVVGDVGLERPRVPAGLLDLANDLLRPALVAAVGDRDGALAIGERACDRGADSARRAGDEDRARGSVSVAPRHQTSTCRRFCSSWYAYRASSDAGSSSSSGASASAR